MTTLNREVFHRDPMEVEIPNLGVAKVEAPTTEEEWVVLDWELSSFVCSGEYERGLERILNTFLAHLGRPQQPAVWVSGFYGSGKSHLVRVLEYLWRDVELPGGRSARDLVGVSDDIAAHLVELTNSGRRAGGLWSAAGTLGAGTPDRPRLAFLSVVFDAAGLPEQYGHARLAIWLRKKGYWDGVVRRLEGAGAHLDDELADMHVSTDLAEALKAEVEGWESSSIDEIHQKLRAEYPPLTDDIGDDEFVHVLRGVLELQSNSEGKVPLTLIVLDEMQQYLAGDDERTLAVQNIVERCSAEFGSSILVAATGQSALTADPVLSKLADRFRVPIHLSDQDVETVVREVVTKKRPDRLGELEHVLEESSGEISRHLGGTMIGWAAADSDDLVPDYPMLPTRTRFWERVLKAIDRAGKAGVLRTQLKLVHEASRAVGGERLGHVVGADFLFFEDVQRTGMLMSGALPREIDNRVAALRETEDGELKARICALVFLITQLPREGAGDIGVRATADTIADLLVEDLKRDGDMLRRRVPELLIQLADPSVGALMRIGDEYQLQTEEGAEWEREFSRQRVAISSDLERVAALRTEALRGAFDEETRALQLRHGTSRTPRRIAFSWDDEPDESIADVPCWVRSEWDTTAERARTDAIAMGNESPIVHVFIPRRAAEAFESALLDAAAANTTIDVRPPPQTEGGRVARDAMRTRASIAEERTGEYSSALMAGAVVMQGGGAEVDAGRLRDAVLEAAENALIRKYPHFEMADRPEWGRVVQKAQQGDPEALGQVGYEGARERHPVVKRVLEAIGGAGVTGADLQKLFDAAPYGWPKDAVNGSLLVLVGGRWVRAQRDGQPVDGVREITPTQIGRTDFFKDDPPLTIDERLQVKGLLVAAGVDYEPDREERSVGALLQRLLDLAASISGEPPLPERPDTGAIADLVGVAGNAQARAVAGKHDDLLSRITEWKGKANLRGPREVSWALLQRLLNHASRVEGVHELVDQRDAILMGRRLLDVPDPADTVLRDVADLLRGELQKRFATAAAERLRVVERLSHEADWQAIEATEADRILAEKGLEELPAPAMGTAQELVDALDRRGLSGWDELAQLMSGRAGDARIAAAELAQGETSQTTVRITMIGGTIRTPEELDQYLADLRNRIKAVLDDGDIAVI